MLENQERLQSIIKKLKIILNETQVYCKTLMNDNQYRELTFTTLMSCDKCSDFLNNIEINFNSMRQFLNGHYYRLLGVVKELFSNIIAFSDTNFFSIEKWKEKNTLTLFFANYILLNQNYRLLKEIIYHHFIQSYKSSYQIVVDDHSPLWDVSETEYLEFPSDIAQIRNIAKILVASVALINKTFPITILEEQVAEILKNAIKHGNKNNKNKKVKIWQMTNKTLFKVIVEDEGEGFLNMDDWNEFNKKRNEALKKGNMEEMLKYIQYKNVDSSEDDGGNSLFAALEYWDSGLVYNGKKNKVVVVKYLYT
ncbi:MAG: ATP-binding protein [Spirochaetes bacterium]|nr:ATP-binding protein [Spirochaetota bacterium]